MRTYRGGAPGHAVALALQQLELVRGHALREGHHDGPGLQPLGLVFIMDSARKGGEGQLQNNIEKIVFTHHLAHGEHEAVVEAGRVGEHHLPVGPVEVQERALL